MRENLTDGRSWDPFPFQKIHNHSHLLRPVELWWGSQWTVRNFILSNEFKERTTYRNLSNIEVVSIVGPANELHAAKQSKLDYFLSDANSYHFCESYGKNLNFQNLQKNFSKRCFHKIRKKNLLDIDWAERLVDRRRFPNNQSVVVDQGIIHDCYLGLSISIIVEHDVRNLKNFDKVVWTNYEIHTQIWSVGMCNFRIPPAWAGSQTWTGKILIILARNGSLFYTKLSLSFYFRLSHVRKFLLKIFQ